MIVIEGILALTSLEFIEKAENIWEFHRLIINYMVKDLFTKLIKSLTNDIKSNLSITFPRGLSIVENILDKFL